MNELENKIKLVFLEWDPINVGEDIAIFEYQEYASYITEHIDERNELIIYLQTLFSEIGLEYNTNNENHIKDMEFYCNIIMELIKRYK